MWNQLLKIGDSISNEVEYRAKQLDGVRHQLFGTASKNSWERKAVKGIEAVAEKTPVGVAEKGAAILGGNIAETVGLDRSIGEVAGSLLIPITPAVAPITPVKGLATAQRASTKLKIKEGIESLTDLKIKPPNPPSGPQLATATAGGNGLSIKPPNLTPQVMEARAKPGMTQTQWDTQRGGEIRIKRDKVENSSVAMRNIEESNPGINKKTLQATNHDEYKTLKKRKEDGQAEVSSAESNIVVPTTDNPYAYPRGQKGAKEYKQAVLKANEALGRSVEQLDLHHLIPKGMSAAIYNRARDFIEKGLVDPKYLNRLSQKFKNITGADTGDLKSGILPMRKPYHDAMHDEMRLQPSDTFSGESLEIMKETLTSKLSKVNNPKDFEALIDKLIKNDIKPLVDNARIWEDMDDLIKSISPKYTGRAQPNALLEKKKKK